MRKSLLFLLAAPLLAAAPAVARCPDTPPLIADGTVEFGIGSAALGPDDLGEVHDLAARAAMRGVPHICVYGSASRRDEGVLAESLALDRAEAVAAELRAAGVPMSAIEVVPVAGGDGLMGSLGGERRVDIVFEP